MEAIAHLQGFAYLPGNGIVIFACDETVGWKAVWRHGRHFFPRFFEGLLAVAVSTTLMVAAWTFGHGAQGGVL